MRARWIRLIAAFVCVISIVGVSYALTKITVQNTSNINAGQNIFITQPNQVNPGPCPPDANSAYIQTPTSLFWNLTAGNAGVHYFFCMDNQGSVSDAVSITASPTTVITSGTAGSCPATGSQLVMVVTAQTPLLAHTATTTPNDIQVCAGSGMTPGAGPSFTITIS